MFEVVTPEKVGLSRERLAKIGAWMQDHVDNERAAGMSVLV